MPSCLHIEWVKQRQRNSVRMWAWSARRKKIRIIQLSPEAGVSITQLIVSNSYDCIQQQIQSLNCSIYASLHTCILSLMVYVYTVYGDTHVRIFCSGNSQICKLREFHTELEYRIPTGRMQALLIIRILIHLKSGRAAATRGPLSYSPSHHCQPQGSYASAHYSHLHSMDCFRVVVQYRWSFYVQMYGFPRND